MHAAATRFRPVRMQGWVQKNSKLLREKIEAQLHIALFLVAITICGIFFGAAVAGQLNAGDSAVISQTLQRLFSAISSDQLASAHDLWWNRMVGDGQLLVLLWVLGVSVIGIPFVVVAVFLRGFSVGFAVGFTVLHFGWKGLIVSAFGIFLHQIISLTALLCAGVIAIRFSAGVLRQRLPLTKMTGAFLRYSASFLVIGLVLMLGALVQAYVEPALLHTTLAR